MKLNPKYLIYHDLIGLKVLALRNDKLKSKNFKDIGHVIDETKNMLITKNKDNKKKFYIKKNHQFRFILPNNDGEPIILEVNGLKIVGRPENRIKDIKKKRWLRK
jgi:RNase P/RNase MRP subunit p29